MSLPGSRIAVLAAGLMLSACGVFGGAREPDMPAPIDVNTAPVRKVETLPGITPSMARRIVQGRPYGQPDDLVERAILTEHELERIRHRIVVQGGR
jgi:DNA uptake protein ComE-like DNA-binding protein